MESVRALRTSAAAGGSGTRYLTPPTIRIGSVDGKKIMELEICKLCLKDKPLISSHLMARGIHDFCRTPDDDPIFISSKVIMQSGRQLQHPLLCRECDGLLSREGENWVLPLLATAEGTFPFHDLLLEGARGQRWRFENVRCIEKSQD